MKLNFAALANKVKSNQSQEGQYNDDNISSQLNYYRKSNIQEDISKNIKHKKSQLRRQDQQELSSKILMGSSILSDYFSINNNNSHAKLPQDKPIQSRINLSVMYPYEVSTSIDPNDIDSQIKQMNSKGILNESAMKFIKKEIAKGLSKSKQKVQKQIKQSSTTKLITSSNQQSMLMESGSITNEKTININEDMLNNQTQEEDLIIITQTSPTHIDSSTKQLLFKNFKKETLPIRKQMNIKQHIVIPTILESSLQKVNKKSSYVSKKPNYMKPTQQTINKKGQKQLLLSTQSIKMQQQLKQVKPKPSLQLTKTSPFTHRVQQQREAKYKQKNSNVFNQLYNQAYIRECMKSIQRQSINKDIEQRQNLDKTLKTEYSQQRYNVKESFKERLERSIEKKYYKEYLIKKYSVNEKTGQPYFQPDTTLSKHTYETLFHKSLQKAPTAQSQQLLLTNPQVQSKKSIHFVNNNKQVISSKNQSVKNISVSYKSAARTKQNSVQRLSHSVDRGGDEHGKGQKSVRVEGKSAQIVQKFNEKIFNRIAGIFYTVMEQQQQQQEDFNKTTQSLSVLSQQQCHILQPLFQQIQSLQQSTRVSSLMFKSLLQQFFYKLNYYDQLVLREIGVDKKRNVTSKVGGNKNRNDKENDRQSTTVMKGNTKMKKGNNMYKPRINDISSSMQKLNPKYDEALYFV